MRIFRVWIGFVFMVVVFWIVGMHFLVILLRFSEHSTDFGTHGLHQKSTEYRTQPLRWTLATTQKTQQTVFVLSLVYMRGGSTFHGRLFASNPDAFYWFEIGQPIYLAMMGLMTIPEDILFFLNGTRRSQTVVELDYIYEHLQNFYLCHLAQMPVEMVHQDSILMSGPRWRKYVSCMKKQAKSHLQGITNECRKKFLPVKCKVSAGEAISSDCLSAKVFLEGRKSKIPTNNATARKMKAYWECLHKSSLESAFHHCVHFATKECEESRIRAAKVMRLRLEDTEALVKTYPNFRIIHQIRDPRGAVLSAQRYKMLSRASGNNLGKGANLFCAKMLEDMKSYLRLKHKYPGNYLQIKYEDLADRPQEMLELVYDFIGMKVPPQVKKHLQEITQSRVETVGVLSTVRKNSSMTAHEWRLKITPSQKSVVDTECFRTLHEGGYLI